MRLLFIIIFFGYGFICSSQQINSDVQVEYQSFYNTNLPIKQFETLYVSNNVSIYQEKYSTSEKWVEKSKKESEGTIIIQGKRAVDDDPYIKVDHNKKEVLFFDIIMKNNFLIKDNYHVFKWDISLETKNISGYLCRKATTNYRGREWVAWFTTKIPLAFGPWKLHGLPGLILEAYDITNRYTFRAVKIEFKKSDIFDKDFSSLMKTKNKTPISYQQFLLDAEEAKDNMYKRHSQNTDATVTRIPIPRTGKELKFEWENN